MIDLLVECLFALAESIVAKSFSQDSFTHYFSVMLSLEMRLNAQFRV